MKVDTTYLVAIYTAISVMVIYIVIDFGCILLIEQDFQILPVIGRALLIGPLAFGVCYYLLSKLIVQRLSVIYKLIRNNRLNVPSSFENKSPDQMLDITELDVKDWSIERLSNREKEELLKKYRLEFTGNISHELKTPLFNVEGYVHTLLDGAMNDPALTKKYLQKTADNVDRLSQIIDALSTISQFESGQLDLEIKEFDIRGLVVECIEELRYLLDEKKVNVIVGGNEYSKIMVFGDRRYIRQVLINLISNSIRYANKDGETRIGFSDITGQCLVEVVDNGIGIEAEHLPHLFDRFYRVDYGRSRKEGGSGIGLAIVKHIINAHGQRVQVSSEYGTGSNFSFTLRKA